MSVLGPVFRVARIIWVVMTSDWHNSMCSSSSLSKCERLGVQLGRVRGWSPRRQPEGKLSHQPAPRLELQTTSFFPSNPDYFYRWKTTWKHSLKRERIFSRDCNSSTVISGCVSTLHHHRSCFLLFTLYLAASHQGASAANFGDPGKDGGQLGLWLPCQLPQGTHLECSHSDTHWEQILR